MLCYELLSGNRHNIHQSFSREFLLDSRDKKASIKTSCLHNTRQKNLPNKY